MSSIVERSRRTIWCSLVRKWCSHLAPGPFPVVARVRKRASVVTDIAVIGPNEGGGSAFGTFIAVISEKQES